MGDFLKKISETLRRIRGKKPATPICDRRLTPRFICSAPVLWEVGRMRGEGQLREVSSSGLRLQNNRAFLAGQHIRIRPLISGDAAPLASDVAIGTVVYSRRRRTGFEIGIELINPERISRFAWIGQLTKPTAGVSPVIQVRGSGLKLLSGGRDNPTSCKELIRPELLQAVEPDEGTT